MNYLNTFFSLPGIGPDTTGRKRVRDGAELWHDPKTEFRVLHGAHTSMALMKAIKPDVLSSQCWFSPHFDFISTALEFGGQIFHVLVTLLLSLIQPHQAVMSPPAYDCPHLVVELHTIIFTVQKIPRALVTDQI